MLLWLELLLLLLVLMMRVTGYGAIGDGGIVANDGPTATTDSTNHTKVVVVVIAIVAVIVTVAIVRETRMVMNPHKRRRR